MRTDRVSQQGNWYWKYRDRKNRLLKNPLGQPLVWKTAIKKQNNQSFLCLKIIFIVNELYKYKLFFWIIFKIVEMNFEKVSHKAYVVPRSEKFLWYFFSSRDGLNHVMLVISYIDLIISIFIQIVIIILLSADSFISSLNTTMNFC